MALEKTMWSATNSEGEYTRFVHVFSLVEQMRVDNPGVHIGEHYSYPWPAPCDPTMGYIEAVYNLTNFAHWPPAWKSFFAEVAVCSDIVVSTTVGWQRANTRDHNRGLSMTGPYLLSARTMGQETIAKSIVEMKREVRRKYFSPHAPASPVLGEILDTIHREAADKIKSHYAPYLVRSAQNYSVLQP